MKAVCHLIASTLIILLNVSQTLAQSHDTYSARIMCGLSNKGQNKDKPYLTAGDRTYTVGTQNGNFLTWAPM